VLIAIARYLIDVIEISIGFWLSMLVANSFAHMIHINFTFDPFKQFIRNLFESFLTLLAVIASVRISATASSIVSEIRHSMRIAFLRCLLIMFTLTLKAE
jgi:hypothetical protein